MSYASSITPNYSYWACTTTATSSCAIIFMFYSCPRNLPCSNPVLCSKLLRANHERTNAVNGRIHMVWFAEKSFGIRSGSSYVHVPFMEVLFWDPEPFYLSAESVFRGSFLHLQKRLHVGERESAQKTRPDWL